MTKPLKIEHTKRTVIESVLLTALSQEGNITIIADEDDLTIIIKGLDLLLEKNVKGSKAYDHILDFIRGLEKLREEAFV